MYNKSISLGTLMRKRFMIGSCVVGTVFAIAVLYRAHMQDTMVSTFRHKAWYAQPIQKAFNNILREKGRLIQSWDELRVELPPIDLRRWSIYTNDMVFVTNIANTDWGNSPQILMVSRQAYPYPKGGNMHLVVLREEKDGPVNVGWIDDIVVKTNHHLLFLIEHQ